jgi:ATP-dependent RNA helicase DeaD
LQPFLAIIFCRTKRRANKLNEQLKGKGYLSEELHGDLTQAKREKVMKLFREAKIQYLVATDVAARGIDVEGVTHVFNYDIPLDTESYVHRIGRTGRAGETGIAITFISPKDFQDMRMIEKELNLQIKHIKLESNAEKLKQEDNRGRQENKRRDSRSRKDGDQPKSSREKNKSNDLMRNEDKRESRSGQQERVDKKGANQSRNPQMKNNKKSSQTTNNSFTKSGPKNERTNSRKQQSNKRSGSRRVSR